MVKITGTTCLEDHDRSSGPDWIKSLVAAREEFTRSRAEGILSRDPGDEVEHVVIWIREPAGEVMVTASPEASSALTLDEIRHMAGVAIRKGHLAGSTWLYVEKDRTGTYVTRKDPTPKR